MSRAPDAARVPQVGELWRSRDRRDDGLTVEILDVTDTHVHIRRFNKTKVRRDRFRKDYIGPVSHA